MFDSFSIVTPNYNMGKYLGETIESVLKNMRPGDEYFIIDGGSTDESPDIIRSYGKYLTGWVSEPDDGYADALAKGFARCSGNYQCWINSGDLLLDGSLDLARKLLKQTKADMIFGDDVYIDENGIILQHSCGKVKSLQNMMLYGGWTPLQDACYWRKDLYDKVGGINRNLKYAGDYALFLAMSRSGICKYMPALFSAFRRHAMQKSITGTKFYEDERQKVRAEIISKNNVLIKGLLNAFYYVVVRIRARTANSYHSQIIKPGINVTQINASLLEDV